MHFVYNLKVNNLQKTYVNPGSTQKQIFEKQIYLPTRMKLLTDWVLYNVYTVVAWLSGPYVELQRVHKSWSPSH